MSDLEESHDSDSEFEDPDDVQVPGGGINLNSIKPTVKDLPPRPGLNVQPPNLIFTPQFQGAAGLLSPALNFPPERVLGTPGLPPYEEFESNEDEGMGVAETYADYMPSKLKIGKKHPDPVVESTSLSSVEPVDVWYTLKLPQSTIDSGALSALQLEAITYACQKHETILKDKSRAGFLIGDGAGVGKGRTIAGIIFENYLRGRKKALWISIMNDLKVDAERDLSDIGAHKIKVYHLNKYKYIPLSSDDCGNIKKGVVFSTYNAIIARANQGEKCFSSRLEQVIEWCGPDFDGVIVFDECHRAKNLYPGGSSKPTKTGTSVVELQMALPNARVVYASATGATEPRNMAYMVRLGMWGAGTPYTDFQHFIGGFQKRGVGAMEILAMDMKLQGLYISRHLSFHGATFKIVQVPLTPEFLHVYDCSTKIWTLAMKSFKEAAELVEADKSLVVTMWSQFWSAHQRFFKYMCISAKVKRAVHIAREAIKCGKCVVIGLQSTGEARTLHQLEKEDGELNDFVSSALGVFLSLVEKHFPAPDRNKTNRILNMSSSFGKRAYAYEPPRPQKRPSLGLNTSCGYIGLFDNNPETCKLEEDDLNPFDKAEQLKLNLIRKINKLGKILPPNTLDELVDELGGPENVAEMTGRKGRVINNEGNFHYQTRSESDIPTDHLNLLEKQRFMEGSKDVAIISEVASSGISLHSDKRAANRKCRVHITLELPWSADRAIQQFGRTHRSNQANAPEYILLISDLAGERRFASVVAKRLESLGALTQGDRRATESRDLSMFNIDNTYGRTAVDLTIKSILGLEAPLANPPANYKGDFNADMLECLKGVGLLSNENDSIHGLSAVEQDRKCMGKFLNRILGMPVAKQNFLFEYFTDTMEAVIEQAKKSGYFDLGILDLAANEQNLEKLVVYKFPRQCSTGTCVTVLSQVVAERGMSWEEAHEKWSRSSGAPAEGFYVSMAVRNERREVVLAIVDSNEKCDRNERLKVYRPNVGLQVKRESMRQLKRKFKKASWEEAEGIWREHFEASLAVCSHMYWNGLCRKPANTCQVGLRRRIYNVLSGSVLSVWHFVERIVSTQARLQVVRLRTKDGDKIVGTLIPASCFHRLFNALAAQTSEVIMNRHIT